jgi:glyoxylase I family protein
VRYSPAFRPHPPASDRGRESAARTAMTGDDRRRRLPRRPPQLVRWGMRVDHVVLWVEDPVRSSEFFEQVLGCVPLRLEEFRARKAPFPSVRVCEDTIIDLMPRAMAQMINAIPGAGGTAGHPVNHVCLAMSQPDFEALAARLTARGTPPGHVMEHSFGARGHAPRAFYFLDPDGNVLEARYYA